MSYAALIKEELLHKPEGASCCRRAELAAYLQAAGVLGFRDSGIYLNVTSESSGLTRRIYSLYKNAGVQPQILFRRQTVLRKKNRYLLRLAGEYSISRIENWLGSPAKRIMAITHRVPRHLLAGRCCRRSYLKGLFLIRGSLSNPEQSYHLEINLDYEESAGQTIKIMEAFGLSPRMFKRRSGYMIYLKGAEQISLFLQVIGADNALMKFENTRVIKEMRNRVNRLVNCDTANLTKTVAAAQKQIEAIRAIQNVRGLEKLPPALQTVARLRLEHPEATLVELGQYCTPPLSKSAVNHRLRRLEQIASTLSK